MPASSEDKLRKLLEFLRNLSYRQFQWLGEIHNASFSPDAPEKEARPFIYGALMVGIRGSVAVHLIEDLLTSQGIAFDAKKMNAQRYGAQKQWDEVGIQSPPTAIPPLEISGLAPTEGTEENPTNQT